ncbi:MAG TPA: DEAD/DEAH box helicase [Vicinamibacterales bacterium]|nr:DEAD/DEAH box helicase [Vicinamibacterales bacterium]
MRSTPMSLEAALAAEFTAKTRSRGRYYANDTVVRVLAGDANRADAHVLGSERYRTTIARSIERNGVRFDVTCTCPAFGREACKHLWALVLIADRRGLLTGDGAPLERDRVWLSFTSVDDDGDEDDFDDEDEGDAESGLEIGERLQKAAHMRRYWAARQTSTGTNHARVGAPAAAGSRFLSALRAHHTAAIDPPRTWRHVDAELMYVVDAVVSRQNASGLVIALMTRRRKQDGQWTKPKPVGISADDALVAPAWDRRLLSSLIGARPSTPYDWTLLAGPAPRHRSFVLSDALTHELLPLLARSGRAFLKDRDAGALHQLQWDEGDPWTFAVHVTATASGFRVGGTFQRDGERLDVHEPALILTTGYLITTRAAARLDLSHGKAALAAIRAMPDLGAIDILEKDATALAEALARDGIGGADLPDTLRVEEVRSAPQPMLRVSTTYGNRLVATLAQNYAGTIIDTDVVGSTFFDRQRRRLIHRDPEAERAFHARAIGAGVATGYDAYQRRPRLEVSARALPEIVRALVAEGWHVEADGRRYRVATGVRLGVSSGIDWFDLDARVDFGDAAATLAEVLQAPGGPAGVRLGDGSIGIVPEAWLARYAGLTAAAEAVDGRLRFRRTQTALLDALLAEREDDAAIQIDAAFARVREELASFTAIASADPPMEFAGRLREYQREGLGWLQFLRRFGFGGCLADDMGLGKTVMVLALLAWRRAESVRLGEPPAPSLVVVPRSLVQNWLEEAARFAPALRVLDHSHPSRAAGEATFAASDIVLTTYGTLRRDVIALSKVEFEYLILDESQAIKNAGTQTAKAARLLRGRHRLALSGTPVENHLGELWSLFEFLNPGVLGRAAAFQRALATNDGTASSQRQLLSRALRPFILRRTKAQVAPELPARTEQTITCELAPKERAIYDGLRRQYRTSVLARIDRDGVGQAKMHILEALLRLRQAACHSGLVVPSRAGDGSAKFEALLSRLGEVVAEGHKALVFSQFTSLLALLKRELDALKMPYGYLDGRTKDRAAHVRRFQEDAGVPLFLISLKAGGVGLNLTAADYVFLLDPWWNPAVEAQAIDRAHRIGQTREVFAYRLIARDTVEEKILELQRSKRALADALIDGDGTGLRQLQRTDIEILLS